VYHHGMAGGEWKGRGARVAWVVLLGALAGGGRALGADDPHLLELNAMDLEVSRLFQTGGRAEATSLAEQALARARAVFGPHGTGGKAGEGGVRRRS